MRAVGHRRIAGVRRDAGGLVGLEQRDQGGHHTQDQMSVHLDQIDRALLRHRRQQRNAEGPDLTGVHVAQRPAIQQRFDGAACQ